MGIGLNENACKHLCQARSKDSVNGVDVILPWAARSWACPQHYPLPTLNLTTGFQDPVALTGLLTCCLGKKNMSPRFGLLPGTLSPATFLDTWSPSTGSPLPAPDTSLHRTCSLPQRLTAPLGVQEHT